MNAITADGSGRMFDAIAGRYDLLNRVLSMGMDRGWRRKLVRSVTDTGQTYVMDLATGTADVAISIAQVRTDIKVTGVDPSRGMLDVGREKCASKGLNGRIELAEGDAQQLDFADNTFDAATIAFGIRNVPDRRAGLREMCRVTKPGGVVAILELSEPRDGPFAFFARFHVRHVVPRLGALLSGADEYRYLQSSVAAFPPSEEFAEMMREAGFSEVAVHRMTFGAAHLYVGTV